MKNLTKNSGSLAWSDAVEVEKSLILRGVNFVPTL